MARGRAAKRSRPRRDDGLAGVNIFSPTPDDWLDEWKNPEDWPEELKKVRRLQFYLKLIGHEPVIWRRFQITSDSDFFDFHIAIQNLMGWSNLNLFRFRIRKPSNGTEILIGKQPGKAGKEYHGYWYDDEIVLNALEKDPAKMAGHGLEPYGKALFAFGVNVDKYFNEKSINSGYEIEYIYDFGAFWKMQLVFESIHPLAEIGFRKRHVAIEGAKAGPPEGVGSYVGFKKLLDIMKKPKKERNQEEQEKMRWLAKVKPNYNPDVFDPKSVKFVEGKNIVIQSLMVPHGLDIDADQGEDETEEEKAPLIASTTFYGRPNGVFTCEWPYKEPSWTMEYRDGALYVESKDKGKKLKSSVTMKKCVGWLLLVVALAALLHYYNYN